MVNQPGSARSSDAAAEALKEVLARVLRHFGNALVRGDSDFDRCDIFNAVIDEGAYFAIGGRVFAPCGAGRGHCGEELAALFSSRRA